MQSIKLSAVIAASLVALAMSLPVTAQDSSASQSTTTTTQNPDQPKTTTTQSDKTKSKCTTTANTRRKTKETQKTKTTHGRRAGPEDHNDDYNYIDPSVGSPSPRNHSGSLRSAGRSSAKMSQVRPLKSPARSSLSRDLHA